MLATGSYAKYVTQHIKVKLLVWLDLENYRNSSPLVKHIQNHHKEETNPQFKIQITGTFHDALSRQADEAVRINSASETDRQMNSRTEFNSAKISRIKLVKN